MRVFKLYIKSEGSGDPVHVRCHLNGCLLVDVTLVGSEAKESITPGVESVMARLGPSQRDDILKRLSSRTGTDIVVPHIRPGQLKTMVDLAVKQGQQEVNPLGYTKPEDCTHKAMAALQVSVYDDYILPGQLRCMNCGANYEWNDKAKVYRRIGE